MNRNDNEIIVTQLAGTQWGGERDPLSIIRPHSSSECCAFLLLETSIEIQSFLFRGKKSYTLKSSRPRLPVAHPNHHVCGWMDGRRLLLSIWWMVFWTFLHMANQKTPPCGTSMRIDYYHSLPFQKITAQSSPHNKQQPELVPPVYSSEQVTIITPAPDPLCCCCCCMSCHNGRSNFPQKYYYNNNILIQPQMTPNSCPTCRHPTHNGNSKPRYRNHNPSPPPPPPSRRLLSGPYLNIWNILWLEIHFRQ